MFSELILSRQNHQSGTTVKKYSAEISKKFEFEKRRP